ncbi:hypothetical protein KQX54_018415 [Cotesia glomerata]|uniref:Uncharacterized protein n=1 Tax=Cotesia glomerata TaxID=32391 RepID=A0AAV7I3X3_COTGL|nr:hypothetical protein KQX54_018415 [Cotesia glomerata]
MTTYLKIHSRLVHELQLLSLLKLFKDKFTQRMDVESFEKEYEYYIKHAYWKIPNSDKCDIIEKFKNGNSGAACVHYFHVDESVGFINSAEDKLKADVAPDVKKRKTDVAFYDCEVKIPDVNKKVGINSTNGIKRIRVEFMDSKVAVVLLDVVLQHHIISEQDGFASSSYESSVNLLHYIKFQVQNAAMT